MNLFTGLLLIFHFFNGQQTDKYDLSIQADKFFSTYVSEKGVNYTAIKNNPTELNNLVQIIENATLDQRPKEYKASFYINSYNILVIKTIINNFPVDNPLKVKGFFDDITHKIADEELTLNDIENIKLRKEFGDNRIHFALVCAGKGCPPITTKAFFPNSLNERLQELTTSALNNPHFIRVDNKNKKVELSQIFEWYQGDFGDNINEVIQYINQHRKIPIPLNYTKGYYEYDWSLNGF